MKLPCVIVIALLMASCRDEGPKHPAKSAEEIRIENEVKRRIAATGIALQHEAKKAQLRTVRIVSFVMLCSGSIACLIYLRQDRRRLTQHPTPEWKDHYPSSNRRVLDLSHSGVSSNPAPSTRYETPRRP